MNSTSPLYLGIDLGTGGVRALVVGAAGDVVASSSIPFPPNDRTLPTGHHEQDADSWWQASRAAIEKVLAALRELGQSTESIAALSVDGTSGTVVGVDADGRPVTPGLMYNDGRAVAEAKELASIAEAAGPSPAGQVAASYAIAKVRWLQLHAPEHFAATQWFAHQADYIAARLSGRWGVSDYSNALKTGYDLLADNWPNWLETRYPEIRQRLPQVVAPGSVIGTVSREVAAELGLSSRTKVVAGATDGTAGFLASGASRIGDDNTTLGTTLVFKRLAAAPCLDPRGLIYCHKLPGGMWLPGAAGNTGCEWMPKRFPGADFQQLDQQASSYFPCEVLAYPLARTGERFPFVSPTATGFCEATDDRILDYAAHLQGVALIERMCYESLDIATTATSQAPAQHGDIFATGGGSRTDIWMQLRADVTGRVYHRPAYPESAFGAAVLAASGDLKTLSRSAGEGGRRPGEGISPPTSDSRQSSVLNKVSDDGGPVATAGPAAAPSPQPSPPQRGRESAGDEPELGLAIRDMVRIVRTFEPDTARKADYDSLYQQFKTRLRERLGDFS